MAATVSSVWSKPGAWALDAEQHDEDLKNQQRAAASAVADPPSADFPSLAAAAASTKTKKKKPQTLTLAEFTSSSGPKSTNSQSNQQRLTPDELLALPTAPRQRSAEELERGFRGFSDSGYNRSSSRVSDRGGFGDREKERDTGFSRADEVDDWSKSKSSTGFGAGSERRERNSGGLFNSRADDVDNWASNKSFTPSSDARRDNRRTGFDSFGNGGGADSDNWGRKKEEGGFDRPRSGPRFDRERRGEGFEVDSERWGKKKEEAAENGNGNSGGGVRPRLNLQPRTLPLNGNGNGLGTEGKVVKSANPFGAARPREEVLAEKGKDWKEIEEKLELKKGEEVDGRLRRRGFGLRKGEAGDDAKERSWRRDVSDEGRPRSAEKIENGAAHMGVEDGVATQAEVENEVASQEEA